MGYFLSQFRKDTLALHAEVEKKTYIDRYIDEGRDAFAEQPELKKRYHGEESLSLLDHYRHLCQLLPIYEILEKKIDSNDFSPLLPKEPVNLTTVLKQAEKIKKDISFLEQYIHGNNQNLLLESTQKYVASLAGIEVTKDEKANEILAHYLVRILGDLFGGQHIKSYVNKMYERNNIPKTNPDDGVTFCSFEKNTLINLVNWLNSLLKDDRPKNLIVIDEDPLKILTSKDYEKIARAGNSAFKTHIELYEELEQSRASAARLEKAPMTAPAVQCTKNPVAQDNIQSCASENKDTATNPSVANNYHSFFNNAALTTAATASAVVLAAGILVASVYLNKPG